MTTARYGCWNRNPYRDYHIPTGAENLRKYRIPHVMTRDCQYRLTELGKSDAKCVGCKHKEES